MGINTWHVYRSAIEKSFKKHVVWTAVGGSSCVVLVKEREQSLKINVNSYWSISDSLVDASLYIMAK